MICGSSAALTQGHGGGDGRGLTRDNVKVEISYVGSPVGAQMVAAGQTDGKFDALWFASNAYLPLQPGAIDKVATRPRS